MLFFISDINMLDSKISLINSKNNMSNLFIHSINHLNYKRDKSIDIYSLENQYFLNEDFNVYMTVNENIPAENIYLYVEDIKNNISKKIHYKKSIDEYNHVFNMNFNNQGLHKISANYINDDNAFVEILLFSVAERQT